MKAGSYLQETGYTAFDADFSGCLFGNPAENLKKMGELGLMGMKERAYLLGGDLEILSAPGKGATVRLSIPRRPA